jgi:hypothetical protein
MPRASSTYVVTVDAVPTAVLYASTAFAKDGNVTAAVAASTDADGGLDGSVTAVAASTDADEGLDAEGSIPTNWGVGKRLDGARRRVRL